MPCGASVTAHTGRQAPHFPIRQPLARQGDSLLSAVSVAPTSDSLPPCTGCGRANTGQVRAFSTQPSKSPRSNEDLEQRPFLDALSAHVRALSQLGRKALACPAHVCG